MLFPEGERKTGPIVQPLFDGAAYVAVKAGVPIVPVGIGGSERAMPKGAKFISPRKVHVVIGKPILQTTAVTGSPKEQRDAARQVTDRAARRAAAPVRHRPGPRRLRPSAASGARSKIVAQAESGQRDRVVDAAQLARRVHRQLGHADVDGLDARAAWR